MTAAALGVLSPLTPPAASADQPFASSVFLATHNSFSGNLAGGVRCSLQFQLEHDVRFVELDIWEDGFATNHDFSIGHEGVGNDVDHFSNPASNLLWDWLSVVRTWSDTHPGHTPLVVMLDLKTDLTNNNSFAAGNLTALNEELQNAFGSKLLRPAEYAAQSVDALRGRILTLLSGNSTSRTEYRADVGDHPAVALNGNGQLVEVHNSPDGTSLWYWTGSYGPDGRVTWLRHGRYDSGTTPAVALNDNGWLVEVHKSQGSDTLWYHVGWLGGDGEISWGASHQYDNGVTPTVVFTNPWGATVREVHRSQNNSQNWTWNGSVNTSSWTVGWSGNAKTSDPLYDKSFAGRGSAWVSVWTGADGPTPANTLRYSTDRVGADRIRYQQIAFDEYQEGEGALLQQDALFYGAPATSRSFIVAARQSGHLVRGWDFDSASLATSPLASYPASNNPWTSWYQDMVNQAGAVR